MIEDATEWGPVDGPTATAALALAGDPRPGNGARVLRTASPLTGLADVVADQRGGGLQVIVIARLDDLRDDAEILRDAAAAMQR